ncbi:unnamed protein product, partial [Medioppia subpectinata]
MNTLLTTKKRTFNIWDFGGQHVYKMRSQWPIYFQNARALVLVVDGTDTGRVADARQLLYDALRECGRHVRVLVLTNKCDVSTCMSSDEL